jgi:hypothetical protein
VEVRKAASDALNQRVGCNVMGRLDVFMTAALAGDDAKARAELLALLKFFPPAKKGRK